MYAASEDYNKKIISDDRTFAIRLTFGSSTVLTGTTIQDLTLDEVINSTDALTMGCACSNKITVNLINPPTDFAYDGADFTAEVGLLLNDRPITYEWIPLGRFYGADAETSNDFKNLKLTAYDGFSKMSGIYDATVESETTLQAIYDDLRTQLYNNCGVVLKERTLPQYAISNFPYLEGVTYTQAMGYVAGCLGENARFDRLGELECVGYSNVDLEIDRRLQYMNGFSRTTERTLTVTSISTGTQNAMIVRGAGVNGSGITFENPYITEAMADDIYDRVNNLTYTPCTVKWRGNPAVQTGDMVSVIDKNNAAHTVLVMKQSLKISGGCSSDIECKGQSQTKSEFSNSFESTGKKIERMYGTLQQAIINATKTITGNSGGYVVMSDTNNDGKPDEILILDKEDITAATKVWRWNKEGLGYAYNPNGNAYEGPYEIAITSDGQINANFITTGTLNANKISVESHDGNGLLTDYIHFGDGYMSFGQAGNSITLKLENDQVAFYSNDVRIAFFSNNSFVIENLTDGLIGFENLEIMPRASGNITFNVRRKGG